MELLLCTSGTTRRTNPTSSPHQPTHGMVQITPFLCMASEMAHDAVQMLLDSPSELPAHPLEHLCLPPGGTFPDLTVNNRDHFLQLLDIYVNDFIGFLQAPSLEQAPHFTHAILHSIHKVFHQHTSLVIRMMNQLHFKNYIRVTAPGPPPKISWLAF